MNILEFKNMFTAAKRTASNFDEFCDELELYLEANKKQATGEADGDYDTEFFDEIVNQLSAAGFSATHREFDKYQGPYLSVRGVDKFWIKEVFYRGIKSKEDATKPYIKAVLVDDAGNIYSGTRGDYFQHPDDYVFAASTLILTKQDGTKVRIEAPKKSDLPDLSEVGSGFTYEEGTMTEVYIFTPGNDPEIGIEVTNKNGIVDASDLVDYCKSVSGVEASIKTASPEVSVGDVVKIDMNIVKKHDNIPPYIRLVNQAIRNAENGMPYVAKVDDNFVYIRAWKFDLLGDVRVPKEAIIYSKKASIKKADSKYKVFGEVYSVAMELEDAGMPSSDIDKDWYEYRLFVEDAKGNLVGSWDSTYQTYNLGQELTKEEAEQALADVLEDAKANPEQFFSIRVSIKKAASGYDFSVVSLNGFDESIINTLSPFGQVNYEEDEDGGAVLEIGVLDVPADKLIAFAKAVESLGASIWSVAIGTWGTWAENLDDLTPTEFVTQILNAKEASVKKADDEKSVTEVVNVPRKISPLEKTKDIPREEYIVAKEANDTLKDLYKSVMELSSQIAMDEEEIKRVAAEMKKTKEIDPSKALLQESIEKLTQMLAESDKIVTINAEKVLKLVEKSSEEPVLSETVLAKLEEMREKHRQIEDEYIKAAGAQMKEIKRTITQELKVIPLRANKTAISLKEVFNKIKNFFIGWMSEAKDFGKELDAITW